VPTSTVFASAIEHATLVEVRGSVEPDIGDSELESIAQLREALCFAGLHSGNFFTTKGYVNAHSFQCIVQNFQPGKLGVGVTARREGHRSRRHEAAMPVSSPQALCSSTEDWIHHASR